MTYQNPVQLSIEAVLTTADETYHRGKCDEAIGLLLSAIEQEPNHQALLSKLAELLLDSEQFADALTTVQKITDPDDSIAVITLKGLSQAGLGDYESTAETAERLLALHNKGAAGFYLKGLVAAHNGFPSEAESLFKKAIAYDPGFGEAHKALGLLRKEAGLLPDALDLMESGFRSSPTKRNVVLAYHNEVVAQADFDRAEITMRAAIDAHPINQRLRYLYIDILLRRQKIPAAIAVIEDCLTIFGPAEGLLKAALDIRGQLELVNDTPHKCVNPQLSLCMITKNEELHLSRCLGSVKNLVDEIILVDTGSKDHTQMIAQAFGARVFNYKWEHDFAKARNYALSKASGDWILILDADETISQQDADQLRSAINGCNPGEAAFTITTRNYTQQANLVGWIANDEKYALEAAGKGWYPSQKVRLFANDSRICFSYPIHELVEPSLKSLGVKIQKCSVPVHHYGKLNEKDKNSKARTYYSLGQKKIDQLGDNQVALREMAVQAAGLEKFAEAADLWNRLLKLEPTSAEALVNIGTAYWNLGDYERAAHYAGKAISFTPNFKEAHFNSALARLYMGDATEAIEILENLIKKHNNYLAAQFMLASAYACADDEHKARDSFNIVRDNLSAMELKIAVDDVASRLIRAGLNNYADNLNRLS